MGGNLSNMAKNIQGQDWSEVGWSNKDNSANRSGGQQQAPKPRGSGVSNKTRALDEAEEAGRHETVTMELRKLIQQGRMAKKMSQKELATQINEKPQTINEYESGKAIPNPQILSKLQRVLGVKLTGLKRRRRNKETRRL